MSPQDWEGTPDLFGDALAVPAAEREKWLEAHAPNEAVLREVKRLLMHHDQLDGEFLEQPAADVRSWLGSSTLLEPGTQIAERFRIIRLLGKGGMGEVYEASDALIGQRIAVKVLNPLIALDPEAVERFRREVILGRKVSHPAVCRIFDLVEYPVPGGARLVLTMELLAGETLAVYLARVGQLRAEETQRIGRGILEGLAAIHRVGVVHRDLKPSNIMLVPSTAESTRAVVTDFGLALNIGGVETALTKTGTLMGTLDYMAPEQLSGGEVTTRTDVYAAGLILYESITGKKPFGTSDSLAAATRRLTRDPVPPGRITDDVEGVWSDITCACLSHKPSLRPPDADAVLALLERPWQARATRMRIRFSRRWLLIGGAAAIPMSLFPWWYRNRGAKHEVEIHKLVLGSIVNATSNTQFDGFTELMRAQLRQSGQFQLTDEDHIRQILTRMGRPPATILSGSLAREVALRDGAGAVLQGRLESSGEKLRLRLRLEIPGSRPEDVAESWDEDFPADSAAGLLHQARVAANWVRKRTGEATSEITSQSRPPEDLTTSNWDALRCYTLATTRIAEGRTDEALTLLERATAIDSDFAAAYQRRADLLISERRYSEGYAAWQKAIDVVRGRKLTNPERFRAEGLFLQDVGEWKRAAEVFKEWVARYPGNATARYHLATTEAELGNREDAIRDLRSSAKLSAFYGCFHHLFRYYNVLGETGLANEALADLRRSGANSCAVFDEGWQAFLTGHPDRALERASELSRMTADTWTAASAYLISCVQAETGDWAAAARTLEKRLSDRFERNMLPSREEHQLGLASVQLRLGQRASVRDLVLQAVASDPGPKILGYGGELLCRAGFPDQAREVRHSFKGMPDFPVFSMARTKLDGWLAIADGQRGAGVKLLENAAQREPGGRPKLFLVDAYQLAGLKSKASAGAVSWLGQAPAVWNYVLELPPGALRSVATTAVASGSSMDLTFLNQLPRRLPLLETVLGGILNSERRNNKPRRLTDGDY